MNRRNFLKFTMGTLGSAMGIATVKADALYDLEVGPKPIPEPVKPCGLATEGKVAPQLSDSEILDAIAEMGVVLDKQNIPTEGRFAQYVGVDLASGPDKTVILRAIPNGK